MKFSQVSSKVADELRAVFDRIDQTSVESLMSMILEAKSIVLMGVGREGLATRALTMRLMHLGLKSHWVWDDTTPAIGPGDLFLFTSGSGEIGHIHYVAEQAKAAGATLAMVTGSRSGKTSPLADLVLWIPASVYKGKDDVVSSIQPMGNLFEQSLLVTFDVMVMLLREKIGVAPAEMSGRHRNVE